MCLLSSVFIHLVKFLGCCLLFKTSLLCLFPQSTTRTGFHVMPALLTSGWPTTRALLDRRTSLWVCCCICKLFMHSSSVSCISYDLLKLKAKHACSPYAERCLYFTYLDSEMSHVVTVVCCVSNAAVKEWELWKRPSECKLAGFLFFSSLFSNLFILYWFDIFFSRMWTTLILPKPCWRKWRTLKRRSQRRTSASHSWTDPQP